MKNNIVVVFSSHLSEDENWKFIEHIDNTIGCKHKVICYPNHNQHSLSQIYNQALKDHNEKDCVFVCCHNDIIIKTQNWGKMLLAKFNNTNFDIIGVAGSTYLPESGRWWDDRTKMVGIVEHTNGINEWVSQYSPEIHGVKEVVLIDGLFMAFNPETIVHRFDETYKGFHFYDLSWAVPNYLDGCDIGVTTSIRILHKSVGMTNDQWEANRQQFASQWAQELPLTIPPPYKDLNPKLTSEPKVSVIIPTKNNLKYVENNLYSWRNNVQYDNYEIIIADTGSDEKVIAAYQNLLNDKIRLVRYDYYNFAKINNNVVRNHIGDDTELVLFCNDDVLLLNDALSRTVEIYNKHRDNVGTIGIRLHFGDASVQHNGIFIVRDPEGNVRLGHKDFKKTSGYDMGVNTNSKGNTGGFMLIKKELFNSLGGFNENYIECLEDVELNLMCRHRGLKNITVSDAVAFHYESISRDKLGGKNERFAVDFERLNVFIKDNQIKI